MFRNAPLRALAAPTRSRSTGAASQRRGMTRVLLAAAVAAVVMPAAAHAQSQGAFTRTSSSQEGRSVEDWQRGFLQATGIGTSEPKENPVQAEAMALQAARVVAQARLVKLISGVAIRSRSVVEDASLNKQLIESKAKGSIQGAVTVDKSVEWVSGGSYGSGKRFPKAKVTLRVCMQNFAKACQQHGGGGTGLYQQMQPVLEKNKQGGTGGQTQSGSTGTGGQAQSGGTGSSEQMQGDGTGSETDGGASTGSSPNVQAASAESGNLADKAQKATGVILNLRGAFQYTPSLSPKVRDENGNVVYENAKIEKAALFKRGPLQYTTNVQQAKSLKIMGEQPYVVDVQRVTSDGQIVISNADAAVLRAANGQSSVLKKAKVAVAQHG